MIGVIFSPPGPSRCFRQVRIFKNGPLRNSKPLLTDQAPSGGSKFSKKCILFKFKAFVADQAPSGGSEFAKMDPSEIKSPSL